MRVLVCDDAEPVRRTLVRALDASGCTGIEEVESAEAALDVLGAGKIDVAVIDHNLPGLSGLDAIRQLRQLGSKTPIVLFTGDACVAERVRPGDRVVHLVKGEMSVADVVATIRRIGGDRSER